MHRVLFVDDDAQLGRFFQRTFATADLGIDVATSGPSALPLLEQHDYDVVVTDYNMPHMDGVELLARVCDRRPDAVRILVTGTTNFEAVVEAVNKGEIFRLLKKPLDADETRFALRLAVETRALRQQAASLREELAGANRELQAVNARLERTVEERTANLLDALISALDFRDTESRVNSRRVAQYAVRLARELCLPEELVRIVEMGALLHDIGKIGVPDAILHKPGKLDDEEWAIMKRHPALGWEILRKIDFLAGAREIVLHHRERYDGTGYPSGLRGDETCIGARIFAVVDTFDAITSDRPYRRAASYAIARAEIERVAATQLDPWIVSAFLRIDESEWSDIRKRVELAAL